MGGKIYSMDVIYSGKKEINPNLSPKKMKISVDNVNKLIGLNLKEKDLSKLLEKMGYDYSAGKASVPAWRVDILHEVDLIEDIAIAYGYDKLTPEIPNVSTFGEESFESKFKDNVTEILAGLGLLEVSSYHLLRQREVDLINLTGLIEVIDSKTDYKFLRKDLFTNCLRVFSENKDHDYPQKIFEIGTVFSRDDKEEAGVKEEENLIVALSPANFTEVKQVLDYLFGLLGVKYSVVEGSKEGLISGRTALIKINGKEIGYMGEVHPETLRGFGVKMPLGVMEIFLGEFLKNKN